MRYLLSLQTLDAREAEPHRAELGSSYSVTLCISTTSQSFC